MFPSIKTNMVYSKGFKNFIWIFPFLPQQRAVQEYMKNIFLLFTEFTCWIFLILTKCMFIFLEYVCPGKYFHVEISCGIVKGIKRVMSVK